MENSYLKKRFENAVDEVLASDNSEVEKYIKLVIAEKTVKNKKRETETSNILNSLHTDKYEDIIYEIEEFINDKIYEIMENLELEDYEKFCFDKKDAIGCYDLSFSGKGVLIFNLNDEFGFVGFDEGEDIIEAEKTEVKFNEEGNPYLDFSHDDIMLNEVLRLK